MMMMKMYEMRFKWWPPHWRDSDPVYGLAPLLADEYVMNVPLMVICAL